VRAVRAGRLLRRLHNKPEYFSRIAYGFMPPKAAPVVVSTDALPPPPGTTEGDLEWIWLKDNGPHVQIDDSFNVAFAFAASQVNSGRQNFMVDWHDTNALDTVAKAKREGVRPVYWKISTTPGRVYESYKQDSTSSAGHEGKSLVHVLVVDEGETQKYYPMIPRIWMSDVAKGLCAVNDDDVIISHSRNGNLVVASTFDSERRQWNSSTRAPSLTLKRKPLPQKN
jgi:hypothetical protein